MSLSNMFIQMAQRKLTEKAFEGGSRIGFSVALKRHAEQLGDAGTARAREAFDHYLKHTGDSGLATELAIEEAYEWLRKQQEPEPAPDMHGSARWAYFSELERGGLLGDPYEMDNLSSRIGLGKLAVAQNDSGQSAENLNNEVFWSGEGPMLTVAPTRSGKGMSQIVPTLLRYPGSVLVMDPKGENYRLTAGYRHIQGSRIFKLDPFNVLNGTKDANDPIDYGETDAFNPLDYLRTESDARTLAHLLHPPVPAGQSAGAKFFADEAINFLTAVILFVSQSASRKNLAEVRRVTTLDPEDQKNFLAAMAKSDNDTVASEGKLALQKPRDKRVELFRSLNSELAIWSEKALQKATERSDFNFADMKDETITVYVILPFDQMEAFSSFIRIVFTTAIGAMLKSQRNLQIPVLFLMDEFPSMGAQDKIVDSVSYLSGYDVRLWIITQTIKRLTDTYPTKWEDLIEQAAVKTFMDARTSTAELVSRWMGLSTVAYETKSSGFSSSYSSAREPFSTGAAGGGESQTTGMAYTGRPLMTPDEVQEWFGRKYQSHPNLGLLTACFVEGQRPFATMRPFWFLNPSHTAMVERGRDHLGGLAPGAWREKASGSAAKRAI